MIGLWRPTILVPDTAFARLSPRQQEMALCHELAHIKRHDLPMGCVPALAEALFFFHPFAWLAAREYTLAREAASDAVVLDVLDAPPQEYGWLLLNLGVAVPRMGLSVAGVASSSTVLRRRLQMLERASENVQLPRVLLALAVCVMAIALVPVRLVARPSTTTVVLVPARALPGASQPAPLFQQAWRTGAIRFDYVMFRDDGRVTVGWMPNGPAGIVPRPVPRVNIVGVWGAAATGGAPVAEAVAHARQFAKPGANVLWFRSGTHEYFVTDPATLRDLATLWDRPRAIGGAGESGSGQASIRPTTDGLVRRIRAACGVLTQGSPICRRPWPRSPRRSSKGGRHKSRRTDR